MKSVLPRLAEFGEEGSETDERIQLQTNKRHHNRVSFYVNFSTQGQGWVGLWMGAYNKYHVPFSFIGLSTVRQ